MSFFKQHRETILYSASLAILLFVLNWMQLRWVLFDRSLELYIGCIALLFMGLGIWLALKLFRPKTEKLIIEKEVYVNREGGFSRNAALIAELDLSKRELDVLALMAAGHSNEEIADKLCVSLSTVKSHNQNLFVKLDVKRRTQAIEKAKRLYLIA